MTYRILVTGSRRFTDAHLMSRALISATVGRDGPITVVHGAASGADELADVLVPMLGPHVSLERWPADWNGPCRIICIPGHRRTGPKGEYCPAAGSYRNQQMVDAGADVCLAFPLGEARGTHDCMARARAAGIRVVDITRPEPEGLW